MSERNEKELELIGHLAKVSLDIEITDAEATILESVGDILEMYASK